ncbi:MAG: cytochrome c-related protein, partial [Candidatus Solibacter sp.]|nr:cytochrome c-related protein [Candidatus Solibacter sp.]
SPDPSTGIGRWSEQDFVNKFAQYREYAERGSPKVGPESFTIMPWLNFCQLPEDDLRAMYAYLRTLPPVSKAVETHPGFDPKVKQMVVSGDRK